MKLVINSAHQRFGGGVQVALSFLNECRNHPEHEYFVWAGPGVSKSLKINEFPENFHLDQFDFGAIGLRITRSIQKLLQQREQAIQPDVIISTSGPSYFHSKAPQVMGYNLPLYIYPESPFVAQMGRKARYKLLLKKQLHVYFFRRDATAFLVQTDDVSQRLKSLIPNKPVYTVSNTANSFFTSKPTFPNKLPERKTNEFRLITISSYYPHKDLEIIPKVADWLNANGKLVTFVLTLKEADFERHIGKHPFIQNVGPIKPEECPSLYAECDALFLPTLAECFSATYCEAMKMALPIVTTDLGFATSICGEAALYYEPRNVIDAVSQIEKLLEDEALRKQLVSKGMQQVQRFDSAAQRARKYLEICQNFAH